MPKLTTAHRIAAVEAQILILETKLELHENITDRQMLEYYEKRRIILREGRWDDRI